MNKPNNNARRSRGRPQGKRNNQRSRGNQQHGRPRANPKPQLEKYRNLAREAEQAGDRITAENYWQYVDHYQRQLNEIQAPKTANEPQGNADNTNNAPKDAADSDANEGQKRRPAKRRGPPLKDNADVVDPMNSEQPPEIRPELDVAAEVPATPRRRGRPKKSDQPSPDQTSPDQSNPDQSNPDQPKLDLNEGAPKSVEAPSKAETGEGGEAA